MSTRLIPLIYQPILLDVVDMYADLLRCHWNYHVPATDRHIFSEAVNITTTSIGVMHTYAINLKNFLESSKANYECEIRWAFENTAHWAIGLTRALEFGGLSGTYFEELGISIQYIRNYMNSMGYLSVSQVMLFTNAMGTAEEEETEEE